MKLIERSASDYKLMQQAKKRGVPKRQLPSFRVVVPKAPSMINPLAGSSAVVASQSVPEIGAELPMPNTAEVYVGNLPSTVSEKQLTEAIGEYCDVESIKFPGRTISGNGGFAFVVISPSSSLAQVIKEMDGLRIGGRRIRAQVPRRISGATKP
ncbi:RNA recognition motif domain-containing protein [Actinoplanes sp. NPDC049599]|uniref:RNA recognition motif domain-containing protein n=1 Tax=Actinoplanes sp. NPDC049599 TaxID=3363903 RepID=UPI0037AE2834